MVRLKTPALLALTLSGLGMAHAVPSKTVAHTTPARDPKTGRFLKQSARKQSTSPAAKIPNRATPKRDPKTGRFLKKTAPLSAPASHK